MSFEKKPGWVGEAIRTGDRKRLSAAGRKGAEARIKKLELEADRAEVEAQYAEEKRIAAELDRLSETNEDILPVD